MSQAQLLPAASPSASLPPITYKGLPVVTTEMLAKAYGCKPQQIKQNFANNKERFTEGKHFYSLQNGELSDFRLRVENFDSQISLSPKARNLTLWLERGAARHAKMLNTDQAWDVFEMLEETFFRVVKPQPTALTPSTADDRKPLRSLVHAWAQIAGVSHQALWPQVKAHFQLARIDDLPVEWIPDALAFVQGKIDGQPKALPEAAPVLTFPDDMEVGRKDAMRRIQKIIWQLHAAMDVTRMFTHPKGRIPMGTGRYDIMLSLYRVADANLVGAYNALEAGYNLGSEMGWR